MKNIKDELDALAGDVSVPSDALPLIIESVAHRRRTRRVGLVVSAAAVVVTMTVAGAATVDLLGDDPRESTVTDATSTAPTTTVLTSGSGPSAVTPRTPDDLAAHGIHVSEAIGEPTTSERDVLRWAARYVPEGRARPPVAVLATVTVTDQERRTRVGGEPLAAPIKSRLAWVITMPWHFFEMGGDPFSTAGRREQHVAVMDAETGRVLLVDRFVRP